MNTPSVSSGGFATPADRPPINAAARVRQTGAGEEFQRILSGETPDPPNEMKIVEMPVANYSPGVAAEGLEGRIDPGADGSRFNIAMTTSGRAIAFDARPVVGPVSVEVSQILSRETLHSGRDTHPLLKLLVPGLHYGGPEPIDLGLLLSDVGVSNRSGRAETPQVNPKATALIPHMIQASAGNPDPSTEAQGASDSVNDVAEFGARDGFESDYIRTTGRLRQSIAQQIARGQVLAGLVATTEEYRVFVRGVTLDHLEERALANAITDMLRTYGLPAKPIAISDQATED